MPNSINSGVKIFLIVEILFSSPKNIEEISNKLLEYNIKADKKTVSKYLRTLKLFGFEIEKINGRFQVLNSPLMIKQKNSGAEIIFLLMEYFFEKENVEYEILKRKFKNIFDIEENLKIKNSIEKTLQLSQSAKKNLELINNLIKKNKTEINAKYKGKKLKLTIKEIKFAKNGVFLFAKDKNLKNSRHIKINNLENIKPDKTKNLKFKIKEGVNFKIKENLIKNYILKRGEIANYINNEAIITNTYEEKEEIFSRLLKYGTKAEILTPEREKRQFIQKLKSLIEHYSSM